MDKLKKTVEQKLGDHPNVSADPVVDPKKGTGIGANQGDGTSQYLAFGDSSLMAS